MKIALLLLGQILCFSAFSKDIVVLKNSQMRIILTNCKLKFNHSFIETLKLNQSQINCLNQQEKILSLKKSFNLSSTLFFEDDFIEVKKDKTLISTSADERIFALAKKEFGIPDFLKKYPQYDGRGIIAGVIDDGVSPHHSGFQKTTTGERKYIGHFSHSSAYTFNLVQNENDEINFDGKKIIPKFIINFDEEKYESDFNGDGVKTELKFIIVEKDNDHYLCLDQDLNSDYETENCQRSFSKTGDYGFWQPNKQIPMMAEIDLENSQLKISEGEWEDDSHGEGVASVFVGHQLFGKYDGVAPGAQLLDYDLSELSFNTDERSYTIGKFLKGISTLAENGANIINMSYSFYFHSAFSQKMMSKALESLIEQYNVLLVFSAGNNGPGLGSMNRSLIYPKNSLVAGAFISKEMDSLVHGASGVDDQGQVVYYSSVGPGADFGMGPTVISPLASITHSDSQSPTRSFSGTSSAAPALAGFSAVLMSAVKQKNLPIDIEALVAAVKYSGAPLKNTPFVFQGFGLPKIDKALKYYQLILEGKLPTRTIIGSTSSPNRDGIMPTGILKKKNLLSKKEEFRFVLGAEFLNLPTDGQTLDIVEVEYSHDWLIGPKRTWLAHEGGAAFSVTADYSEMNLEHEIFAEVRLIDPETKTLLAVFPITIINEELLNSAKKMSTVLGPEKGYRYFFKADENVNGFQLFIDMTEFLGERITYRLYDKSGVVLEDGAIKGGNDLIVEYDLIPGESYQIGFSRYRGNLDIDFNFRLLPIKIKKQSSGILSTESFIMKNEANNTINGLVGFKSKDIPQVTGIVKPSSGKYIFNYTPKEEGYFSASLLELEIPDLSYSSSKCFQQKNLEENFEGGYIEINSEDIGKNIQVVCYLFDIDSAVHLSLPMKFEIYNESIRDEIYSKNISISPNSFGNIEVEDLDLKAGNYEVFFKTLNGAKINLGEVEVFTE